MVSLYSDYHERLLAHNGHNKKAMKCFALNKREQASTKDSVFADVPMLYGLASSSSLWYRAHSTQVKAQP